MNASGGADAAAAANRSTKTPLDEARIIELPTKSDARGNLSFIEAGRHVPFEIRRVYYLYDIPEGGSRGGHAHRALEQVMIAAAGSFDVVLGDGRTERRFSLASPDLGLLVPRMAWRTMEHFSASAVCLVLASQPYDESDYYRDYDEFLAAVGAARPNG